MGHVAVVNLVSRESGVVGRFHGQTLLRGLHSFVDICNTLPEGERLSATVDLFNCPGIIYLAHRDLDQLNADIARLRRLPMSALYAFTPALAAGGAGQAWRGKADGQHRCRNQR
jgi:hypothetical protein